jgi:peptide/nickel transport system substrate-binding protein
MSLASGERVTTPNCQRTGLFEGEGRVMYPCSRRVPFVILLAVAALDCQAPVATREIRIGHEADLVSLDPTQGTDSVSKSVLSNIYDTLVDWDERLVPALAVSWSNPDERTWLFRLRKGVHAHDGTILTAEDVQFSLERARSDRSSTVADRLSTVDTIDVIDDSTVRVRTSAADPLLLNRLTDIFIAPRGRAKELGEQPVGTGPYRFARRSPGVLEVEAFSQCWRGAPPIGRARFVTVKFGEGTLTALRAGSVDILRWVPEARVKEVESISGFRVVARAGLRAVYLWMNSEPGRPFADTRVRRAISLSLDRAALVERLGGHGHPLQQFLPANVIGNVPGLSGLPLDRAAAARLLREAGYQRGFETPLSHVSNESLAEAIRDQLKTVGIEVKLDSRVWPDMLKDWHAARLPFFLGSWWFASGEVSMFLKECISTRDPRLTNSWNPGYSNPRLDELIRLDFQKFDEDSRAEGLRKLTHLLLDEMPLVPLLNRDDLYAVRSGIKWTPRLDGKLLAAEIDLGG